MQYPPLPEHHPVRSEQIRKLTDSIFDVVIIGGGINGTCLYHHLKQKGYRTAILDKNDFGSGTTQNSGMMIWGGLLYLQNFDLRAVYQFSKARDHLIKQFPEQIIPRKFHFIRSKSSSRNKFLDYLGLYLYWMFSQFKRQRPQITTIENNQKTISFEEGQLLQSDAHFALTWLGLLPQNENLCMNYFEIKRGRYNSHDKLWHLEGLDTLYNKEHTIRAKWIINASGIWADQVNDKFDISTPYKHIFSKGVYLNLINDSHDNKAYIYEMGQHQDVLTYVPWGPVALWGPTETISDSIEDGFTVNEQDISFLLEKGRELPNKLITQDKIVSTRCGIRPLVIKKSENIDNLYSLKISRMHRIHVDATLPWMSIYGGKLSGCTIVSQQAIKALIKHLKPTLKPCNNALTFDKTPKVKIPEFNFSISDAKWCMENQFCFTLDDYLRRRTNISQWIENNGFGLDNQFTDFIKKTCLTLCLDNTTLGQQHFEFYQASLKK